MDNDVKAVLVFFGLLLCLAAFGIRSCTQIEIDKNQKAIKAMELGYTQVNGAWVKGER